MANNDFTNGNFRNLEEFVETQSIAMKWNKILEGADYDSVKDRLSVKLVNTEYNKEKLRDLPHTDVGEMSMYYALRLEDDGHRVVTANFTYKSLELFGISKERLHEDAMENMNKTCTVHIQTLAEKISELTGIPQGPDPFPTYVFATEGGYEAAMFFYPGMMDTVYRMVEDSYYVIPSSVHEMMLVPDSALLSAEEITTMIRDVNASAVSPDERLADNVYHYDAKSGIFELGETYEARRNEKAYGKEGRTPFAGDASPLQEKASDSKKETEMKQADKKKPAGPRL